MNKNVISVNDVKLAMNEVINEFKESIDFVLNSDKNSIVKFDLICIYKERSDGGIYALRMLCRSNYEVINHMDVCLDKIRKIWSYGVEKCCLNK